MQVLKKNGVSVSYDVSKINSFLELITQGIDNVSMSDIIMNSDILLYDGISTTQINSVFIKSAENLITEETPNYDLVAGRILMSEIRKSAYGDFDPDDLYEIVSRNVLIGRYDPELLIHYTKEEFEYFDMFIDHDRDLQFSIAGVREWEDKYLVKDKKSNQFFESPQVSYMLMAMSTFMYDQGNKKYSRSDLIKLRYEHLSLGYVNSPSPQSAGLRTSTRNYSSCVLLEADDSIDGISAVERVSKKYATLKAGLGIGVQGLRATGQPIRNGEAINTGVLPHAKSIELSATSCSQGGIRKGSCTFNWLGWHLDFEDIIRYKNGAKLDDDSMKHSDHSILINEYLWTRALNNEDIWLFSPEQVPDLYNSFFLGDNAIFEKLYLEAIDMPGIAKKRIPATEWIFPIVTERFGTGRIYLLMMDNTNKYSPFIPELAPVRMSNLCVEINQHTEPLKYVTKEDGSETIEGLIALCNLGGINFGLINDIKDLEEICMVTVRAIDNLLDLQYYPFEAARLHNELYRPMGIGITGLAYWLAKNDLNYSNCYYLLDEWVDFWSYSIIKASMELSLEKGACKGFKSTKWSQGILPVDNYAKAVDEIYAPPKRDHWNYIRENIQEYGIRNATLMAIMPSETSAKISGRGTTNGVEPIRDFIVQKGGKSSKGKFVAPELSTLKDKYDLVWDWTGCTQLIQTYAIIQKYTDQSLSANTYYGKNKFPGGKIPVKTIIKDITLAIKYGLKSLYYNNNDDDNTELFNGNMIVSPQQKVILDDDDNDCESCKL